jgi:hypothetical protein
MLASMAIVLHLGDRVEPHDAGTVPAGSVDAFLRQASIQSQAARCGIDGQETDHGI